MAKIYFLILLAVRLKIKVIKGWFCVRWLIIINNGGLLPKESEVLKLITNAWNKYCELEKMHPSDIMEFHQAIHQLQQLMAIRVSRREYPDFWISYKE